MVLGALKAHSHLQLKPDSKPYQAPPRHVAYVLQKPLQGGAGMPAENVHHHTTWGR